ncbi:Tachykinin-like peptides receptor 99D, partial [Fragariocoptes setiger]
FSHKFIRKRGNHFIMAGKLNKIDEGCPTGQFAVELHQELTDLLYQRLVETGSKDRIVDLCKQVIMKRGINNVTAHEIMAEVLPIAQNQIPGHVREELQDKIRQATHMANMIKMMITCVIAFALTWLPFNAFIVIGDYYPSIYTFDWIIYIWFVSHYLAMCHTITNPIIYYWMNNRFRLGFRYVFYNVLCCCRHSMNDLKHGNVTDHELEHTRCTNLNAYNRSGESGNSRLLHANNNNHHTNNSHSQTSDLNSNNNGTIVKPSSGSVRVKHGQGNEYVTLGTDWPGSRVTGSTSASNVFSKTDSHSAQHYEALQPTKDGTRDEQSGIFLHFDEKDPTEQKLL